jgi:hypothetical protein
MLLSEVAAELLLTGVAADRIQQHACSALEQHGQQGTALDSGQNKMSLLLGASLDPLFGMHVAL